MVATSQVKKKKKPYILTAPGPAQGVFRVVTGHPRFDHSKVSLLKSRLAV